MSKMFLVEKGTFVIIRNAAGVEVGFGSFADFHTYCDDIATINTTGKNYIDYEPDRGIYIDDSDSNIDINDAPEPGYETLITNVQTIKDRVEDPFWNLSLADAKTLRKNQIKGEAMGEIYTKWPTYKQDNTALGGVTGYDASVKSQMVADINTILSDCATGESSVDAAADVAAVKAVTVSWTSI